MYAPLATCAHAADYAVEVDIDAEADNVSTFRAVALPENPCNHLMGLVWLGWNAGGLLIPLALNFVCYWLALAICRILNIPASGQAAVLCATLPDCISAWR